MMNCRILDCTLRDGSHVNEGWFGKDKIKQIIRDLVDSKVNIIELGFLKNGDFSEDQTFFSRMEEVYPYLEELNEGQEYSVMIRPDWYDISLLTKCNGLIKNIRFAFYYKDIELTKKYCRIAKEKGYNVFLNPVNIMSYNEKELIEMLHVVNEVKPFGVTIVDTFGAMHLDDLVHIYGKYEEILDNSITIGLHLHENLSLAFALAQKFLEIKSEERNVTVDGSLLGMGRIPGNLCVEIILNYFNEVYFTKYELAPIYNSISKIIEPIKMEKHWGYSPAYFMTGMLKVHRSYAEYLINRNVSLNDISIILNKIKESNKKNKYDEAYIAELYSQYKGENNINKEGKSI